MSFFNVPILNDVFLAQLDEFNCMKQAPKFLDATFFYKSHENDSKALTSLLKLISSRFAGVHELSFPTIGKKIN